MTSKFEHKELFVIIIVILLLADLAILLNIPFIRQVFGFLFLTFLPGLLILQILKLDKLEHTEKVVLSVGLSISFLMFFGLLINTLSLSLDYDTPLSTIPLLISFNSAIILLTIICYILNKNSFFSIPNLNLTTSEKAFLIVPILFPALSILGKHILNTTDNNNILIVMFFLIAFYTIFICFFNQKFSVRLYPVVIFLISISLLLLMPLTSNHIIGSDIHEEYYLFQIILDKLHWDIIESSSLNACLSISLLPVIYQSILNSNPEFLYKIFYSLIFSITPIVIFVISKRYIKESFAFLASLFFMFQEFFLYVAMNPRTSMAILFFALAMMILFNNKMDPIKRRILFIVFIASGVLSHYATTYIFFFIMLGACIGLEMLSKKYTFKKVINLTTIILFFTMLFFWYSQVMETTFDGAVKFIESSFANLNTMFIEESRTTEVQELFGGKITQESTGYKIKFISTWMTFVLIGIGILTLMRRYKEMCFPELNFKKPEFLKDKFYVEYSMIALSCTGILVMCVAVPYITEGYDTSRPYTIAIVVLSTFFVIGGIMISRILLFLKQTFKKSLIKKKLLLENQKEREKVSQVLAYLVILLVLIPYFLSTTNVTSVMFDEPHTGIILLSGGETYDILYIRDQESYGPKWLREYGAERTSIHTDTYRKYLVSQGEYPLISLNIYPPPESIKKIEGYLVLRYYNIARDKIRGAGATYNMTEFSDIFVEKNTIYTNGGFEIWN